MRLTVPAALAALVALALGGCAGSGVASSPEKPKRIAAVIPMQDVVYDPKDIVCYREPATNTRINVQPRCTTKERARQIRERDLAFFRSLRN